MNRYEKIGLGFSIIASILSILEYLKISFSLETFTWIPSFINSTLSWIYENIVLFELNIWILFIVLFLIYKINVYIKNFKENTFTNKASKPKSLLEIFDDFEDDTKKVFYYVMYCEEKNIECTKESTSRHLKDTDITNIELDKILDNLVSNNFIKNYPNFMHPTTYGLSEYGSDIAVALVKKSKEQKKEQK